MTANHANALAISNLTEEAWDHLSKARRTLSEALKLAEADYDHNADRLRDALGTVQLLIPALITEHHNWFDMARARARFTV